VPVVAHCDSELTVNDGATPAWQMRALGLVNRTVREINEMSYEFDEPFIVDSSRAETELGLRVAAE
jgi:hypothetical protein